MSYWVQQSWQGHKTESKQNKHPRKTAESKDLTKQTKLRTITQWPNEQKSENLHKFWLFTYLFTYVCRPSPLCVYLHSGIIIGGTPLYMQCQFYFERITYLTCLITLDSFTNSICHYLLTSMCPALYLYSTLKNKKQMLFDAKQSIWLQSGYHHKDGLQATVETAGDLTEHSTLCQNYE